MFVVGVLLGLGYLGGLLLLMRWRPGLSRNLLSMTGAALVGGRAAGISVGYQLDLPHWLVVSANTAIETVLVLLIYPLFVLYYRELFVIRSLRGAMERTRRAAEASRGKVLKWGIPGLFLFVWFPFWMTGPVVGSIIGLLIGLPVAANLAAVLSGTFTAILCWGVVLRRVSSFVQRLGPYVSGGFVAVVLLFAVWWHIRMLASGRGRTDREKSSPPGRG